MKNGAHIVLVFGLLAAIGLFASCSGGADSDTTITVGTSPGPYGHMFEAAIAPQLEEAGYEVKLIEFSDYVQPNLALENGEIDVNLFQHKVYLDKFAADHDLHLTALINVPTAAMGLYSNTYQSLEDLPDGATVSIPNDPTNLARALKVLQQAGLIGIDDDIDVTTASENDIVENSKNLVISPVEAAQLPRTVDSVDLAAVPGNYALAAGMSLSNALYIESLPEEYKNLLAVRNEDADSELAKLLVQIVRSQGFRDVMEDPNDIFQGFTRPEWYN